jgi:sporulation protein YlmC with PRC-barrel domain
MPAIARKGETMLQSVADLKRYPVYNRSGAKLGVIDDVILDADDWSVCYAVLRYEDAGEPHKLLGVALEALSLDSENECLIVAADADALRNKPSFEREAPPARPEPLFKPLEP